MERALAELKPPGRWLGRRLDLYRETDSTNRIAEALALAGAPEGTVVAAERQTAGRGRLGRSFFSPTGGLYLSLVLRPAVAAERAHEYVFLGAVAVAETLAATVPAAVPVEIKWPNDVLLHRRKACGINLPTRVERGRVEWAVLGIGVNVNLRAEELPAELAGIATSVRIASGRTADRIDLGEALLGRLEARIDRYRAEGPAGFRSVLEDWGKFFRMHGARIRVGGPGAGREIEGTVEGVAPDGALRLRTPRGPERILAGDVTILRREERG